MENNINLSTSVSISSTFAGKQSAGYIAKLFEQNNSLRYVTKHYAVRKTLVLRVASNTGILQAYACAPTPSGTVTVTERLLSPNRVMIVEEICKQDLINAWQDQEDTRAFVSKELPRDFSSWLTEDILTQAIYTVELNYWYGNTASTSGNVAITASDGIFTLGNAASTAIKISNPSATVDGSNGMTIIKQIIAATPAVVRQHPDFKIGTSIDLFFAYQDAYFISFPSNANYNVNNGVTGSVSEQQYLGTPIFRLPSSPDSKPHAIATFMNPTNGNLHLGANLADDVNSLSIIDKSMTTGEQLVRFTLIFDCSSQIARPEYTVLYGGTIA